jgi:hypothetical protein
MTASSPGKGAAPFPPGSPSGFLRLERALEVMKFFYHGALFKHVFDGVCMVQTYNFEKFLKMFFRLSWLVVEVALGGHTILLLEVIRFVVIIVPADSDCEQSGAPPLSLLPPLVLFLLPCWWILLVPAGCYRGLFSHCLE